MMLNISQKIIIFVTMGTSIKCLRFKKLVSLALLVCAAHVAFGSFTGTSDKKTSSIFSLKNFNKNFFKTASPFSLKAGYNFKGFQVVTQKKELNRDISFNSIIRYEKGNTSYIYPYKHKVSLSKFKTPAPPDFR